MAKVSILLEPLQIAPAPLIVLTVESGFILTTTPSEVVAVHKPLDTTTL